MIQSAAFEICGFFFMIPFYYWAAGGEVGVAAALIVSISIIEAVWAPIYNILFDLLDFRFSGRVASDRPHVWRVVHAICHEVSTMLLTVPILVVVGGFAWLAAIFVDISLTAAGILYAFLFHLIYDAWRPVRVGAAKSSLR